VGEGVEVNPNEKARGRRCTRTKNHELKIAALFDLTKSLARNLIK
jgi:hypothetical protein